MLVPTPLLAWVAAKNARNGGARTSNYVRRSSITVPRPRAIFTNILACMSALRISRVMLRAIAMATPGVTNIAALLSVHDLAGPGACASGVVFLPLDVPMLPVGSTAPSLDAAARGSLSRLRTMPLAWLLVLE